MENYKSCCFFGHRKIRETAELRTKLKNVIENLITSEKVVNFYFGSRSQFDELCLSVVSELREKYRFLKRIYVRAEFPYIDDSYKDGLLKRYEDTYYPEKILNAGSSVYVERNYEMIDNSNFCVIYFDEDYSPPRRKHARRDIMDYQPKSGTRLAYEYAVKKGLIIYNIIRDEKL